MEGDQDQDSSSEAQPLTDKEEEEGGRRGTHHRREAWEHSADHRGRGGEEAPREAALRRECAAGVAKKRESQDGLLREAQVAVEGTGAGTVTMSWPNLWKCLEASSSF